MITTVSDVFTSLLATFTVILNRVLQNLVIEQLILFIYHEEGILFQNIVDAECLFCILSLNIVGAAAPMAPIYDYACERI